MATQMRESPTGPAGKNDAFIAGQIRRAEQRIRFLDLVTALTGLAAGALGYAILMIVLDRQFVLSAASRQMGLVFFLIAVAVYVFYTVVRPLSWRVNPHYAARMLEGTLPGSKNHVINWIDLREEPLPGVIRSALGHRAAKDLTRTDVEQAISNRRGLVVGSAAAVLFAAFIALFLMIGPRPFRSYLSRTLAPFASGNAIATRTQVSMIRPEGGDATVTIGQQVQLIAQVSGRVPDASAKDAPCLLYRRDSTEPYRQRFLRHDPTSDQWSAVIAPIDVGNGFFYKVTAGDSETPEYRVQVRAAPLIADFLATYRYRPYTGQADRARTSRTLDDLRGTEVQILARTNRQVQEGRLDYEGNDGVSSLIVADRRPDDPQALRFRLTLDRPGKYRIRFTSDSGETYLDPVAYEVLPRPDRSPAVRLTAPAVEVKVPVNGSVELKGEASDDYGVAALAVYLQVVGGPTLRPKAYLADKLGKPGYGTPRQLDYRELLELPKLTGADGQPVPLRPGMILEYWLEARDGCDYPSANVGRSEPRHRLLLDEPVNNPEQQKKDEAARDRQQKHEEQQGDQLKKEQAERDEQKKQDEAREQADARQREQEKGKSGQDENKDDKEPGKNEPNKDEQGKGEQKNDQPDKGAGGEQKTDQERKDEETRRQAEELKEALDRKDREQGKGEQKPGEGKDSGEQKPGESKDSGEQKPGEGKDAGDKGKEPENKQGKQGDNQPGEKKDGGDKSGQPGESRGEGKQGEGKQGEGKQGESKQGGKPGEQGGQPGESKADQTPRQGQSKGAGKESTGNPAGETRPQGDTPPGEGKERGEAKESKSAGKPGEPNRPAEKKEGGAPPAGRGEAKAGEKPGEKGGEVKPTAGERNQGKPGEGKGSDGKDAAGARPGEGKGSGPGKPAPEDARPEDARRRADELKNGSDKGRQEAARDLQAMRDRAKDPQTREAARDALDKAGKQDGAAQPGEARPAPARGAEAPGEAKGNDGKQGEGEGKQGEPKPARGEPAGESKQPGKPSGEKGGEKGAEGQVRPGQAKTPSGKKGGDEPGEGMTGPRKPSLGTANDADRATPAKPEKAAAHRASTLQLETFRKKVDPNVLRDARMSPEQYQQFLRDYAELAKRQPAAREEADVAPGPGSGRAALPSTGGRVIKAPEPGKVEELQHQGRPKPPPEYRDAHSDFLRRLLAPAR